MKRFVLVALVAASLSGDDGKALYSKYGCYGCHGTNAEGTSTFPKLARLPSSYIEKRLLSYKEGKINSNRANIMKPYAKKLTKKEIQKLAEYLHNIKTDDEDRYYQEYEVGDSAGS